VDSGGKHTTTQIYGKAYPAVREMIIARAMADQGIVSSLCPIHEVADNGDVPPDPLFGYRPAVNVIVRRLKKSLLATCLPQKLLADASGVVPCLIFVTLPATDGSCLNPTCSLAQGLSVPETAILTRFCQAQEEAWTRGGGTNSDVPDPSASKRLPAATTHADGVSKAFDATGSCGSPTDGSPRLVLSRRNGAGRLSAFHLCQQRRAVARRACEPAMHRAGHQRRRRWPQHDSAIGPPAPVNQLQRRMRIQRRRAGAASDASLKRPPSPKPPSGITTGPMQ